MQLTSYILRIQMFENRATKARAACHLNSGKRNGQTFLSKVITYLGTYMGRLVGTYLIVVFGVT